jgi:hypothetical protein
MGAWIDLEREVSLSSKAIGTKQRRNLFIIRFIGSELIFYKNLSAMSGKKDAQSFRDDFYDEWLK